MATKVKKQSTGRQKIEIKKIENKSSLEVTFTKRRHGLFNKASELCALTGAEAAVVVFSPGKKAFVFGYPSVDTVVDRYIKENTNEGRLVLNTSTASRCDRVVQESREQYVEALAKKEEAKKRMEMMMKEGGKVGFGLDRFWWDLSIEEMGLEELEQYVASMEELKKNVGIRVDELEKASKYSPSKFFAFDSGLSAIDKFGIDEGY